MADPSVIDSVGERIEFRYGSGSRWGSVACLGFFLAWIGFIVYAYAVGIDESTRRMTLGGVFALCSVPFGMALLCLYWMNQVFGTIAVDDAGVEIVRPLGRFRGEFNEFDRLEPLRSNKEGFILWTPEGKSFKVDTNGLVDAPVLRDHIKQRIFPGPRRALEETELRAQFPTAFVALFGVVAAFFVAFPWLQYGARTDALPLHAVYDIFALLLVAAAVQMATTRVRLFPDRVEKRSALGAQTVRFADVKKVELEVMHAKGGSAEVVRLVHSGRDLTFSPQITHFNELRNALIERCSHAKIQDSRPAEYR